MKMSPVIMEQSMGKEGNRWRSKNDTKQRRYVGVLFPSHELLKPVNKKNHNTSTYNNNISSCMKISVFAEIKNH